MILNCAKKKTRIVSFPDLGRTIVIINPLRFIFVWRKCSLEPDVRSYLRRFVLQYFTIEAPLEVCQRDVPLHGGFEGHYQFAEDQTQGEHIDFERVGLLG